MQTSIYDVLSGGLLFSQSVFVRSDDRLLCQVNVHDAPDARERQLKGRMKTARVDDGGIEDDGQAEASAVKKLQKFGSFGSCPRCCTCL